jgi:multiple sugar transport system substrate-binding protein
MADNELDPTVDSGGITTVAGSKKKVSSRIAVLIVTLLAGWVLLGAKMSGASIPGRTKVVFWHRWGGEWEVVVKKIVGRFNESQTEFEVVPLFVTGQGSETKFMLSTIGGNPPDVMSMGSESLPSIAAGGLLTDLETLMTPEERDYFHRVPYPAIRETGQLKGVTYGITIGADLMGYYVNCDQLREVGADPDNPPKTFEELVALGQKLTKRDKNGNIVRLGLDVNDLITQSYAWGSGIEDAKTGKLLMNTPTNLAALTALANQKKGMGFDEAQRFFSSQNTGSSTGAWPFIPGAISIAYDGQWRVEEIRKYRKGMDYRVWPLIPPAGGRPFAGNLGGNFMIIPTSAKQKKGAFEFLKFWSGLTHPERAAEFYTWGGWVPLSPDIANSPIYSKWLDDNPQFRTFVKTRSGNNCHASPRIGFLQYYLDQFRRAEDKALRGSLTPEQALTELESSVNTEIRKRKELGFDDR